MTSETRLTSARLVQLLTSTAAALEREARIINDSGGTSSSIPAAHEAATAAIAELQRACQLLTENYGDAVAAQAAQCAAGRVPLPWPSAGVEAALETLERLIAAGCAEPGNARELAKMALLAVLYLTHASPRRTATLAARASLVPALVRALAVRGDDDFLHPAVAAAVHLVQYASLPAAATEAAATAAAMRAAGRGTAPLPLAVALAGGFGALAAADASPQLQELSWSSMLEHCVAGALVAAINTSRDSDRAGFRAALVAQPGFLDALCACIARSVAELPSPGARNVERFPAGSGALALVAALCDGGAVNALIEESRPQIASLSPRQLQQRPRPGTHPVTDKLLAASPALLGRVVDVVTAGAPWYGSITAALGSGGARGAGGAGLAPLTSGFVMLAVTLWDWAVSVLEVMPMRALTAGGGAGGGRDSQAARLAPALLDLAEALQAAAGAHPGPGLESVDDGVRFAHSQLAAAALRVFDAAARALGGAAAAALVDRAPGALAALVRLSVSEPPLFAGAGLDALEDAQLIFHCHAMMRLGATEALAFVAARAARLAPLLASSPALAAAVGAAVGATSSERRILRGPPHGAPLLAKRRALTAGILARLAAAAAGAARRDASWLCDLST